MSTTTESRPADVGGRNHADGAPPMPPVTWPHDRHPAPGEWVAYFLTLSGRQREYAAGTLLEFAQRGTRCAMSMHDELLASDTLSAAQIKVQAHLDDTEGIGCPCCGQLAKRYRRKINGQMAAALIKLFREHNKWTDRQARVGLFDTVPADDPTIRGAVLRDHDVIYLHLPTLLGRTADEAKLAYWKLIAPLPATRDDGSTRTGWWTITDRGRAYARGDMEVPTYALVFDGKVNGFDGPPVDIHAALGARFNYDDLMAGR